MFLLKNIASDATSWLGKFTGNFSFLSKDKHDAIRNGDAKMATSDRKKGGRYQIGSWEKVVRL